MQEKSIFEPTEIIPMSKETKERLAELAKKIEGKELFSEAIQRAKESLKNVKSLPI